MLELSCVRDGERVLAAVSGGADSVAMLRLLHREAEKGRIVLFAAHFEHGIRGADSERDAAFVETLCARFGVPFFRESGDVPAMAREKGMGLEAAAREARYAFLRRIQAQVQADCIALAHHRDDQAETVLMHILRGASLQGARGMEVRRGDLYRPLLHAGKADILAWLAEIGQPYCEDATNLENDNPRNLLRNQVMPVLEQAYPGAGRALSRFAAMAARDEAYLQAQAQKIARIAMPGGWIFRLGDAAEAVASRAIASEMDVDSEAMGRILALSNGGRTQCRGYLWERRGTFWFARKNTPQFGEEALELDGETVLRDIGRIWITPTQGAPVTEDMWRQRMDRSALEGCVLRVRRTGDWMVPFGMGGRKLLSDIFTDRKLPGPLRDRWPVVARGSEIVWIPGMGISEKARMTEKAKAEARCQPEEWLARWLEIRKEEEHA